MTAAFVLLGCVAAGCGAQGDADNRNLGDAVYGGMPIAMGSFSAN